MQSPNFNLDNVNDSVVAFLRTESGRGNEEGTRSCLSALTLYQINEAMMTIITMRSASYRGVSALLIIYGKSRKLAQCLNKTPAC